MPAPKDGTAGKAVLPDAPEKPLPADNADPGKLSDPQGKKGQNGPPPFIEPNDPNNPSTDEETSWIEIELVGKEDQPIPGERYRIILPDGRVAEGTLDENGFKRLEGIPPGNCDITFPKLHKDSWEKIS